jgi:Ca-activated chloride channel homolog
MKNRVLWLILSLATALVVAASGCSGGAVTQTQTVTAGASQQTVTKTVTAGGGNTMTVTAAAPTTYYPLTTGAPSTRPQTVTPTLTYPATSGYYPPVTTQVPNIGLAAGGAKDVANFRENIKNNFLPLPTDVSYEGLFYDYYFDTGASEPTNKLFAPSYTFAVSKDPFSGKTEYYLAVGLNSGMKESDFARKKLNLVIVLDNSGSMGETFNQYYYDGYGNRLDAWGSEAATYQRKIDNAKQAVADILSQLRDGDRVAIVLFNSNASLLSGMRAATYANRSLLSGMVMNVTAGGSTNLADGLALAGQQFKGYFEANSYEYENRIILLTDAMPNTGDYSSASLTGTVARNAQSRIYTTVIGVGVDFNSELVNELTQVKGANYYTVHSHAEFARRIQEEFDYMVTPLIFNLRFYFEAKGWEIEKVFGSPEADLATGDLMRINTLFPAKSEGGENRGGIVLLKLRKTSLFFAGSTVSLKVTYEDRNGRTDMSAQQVALDREPPEYFDNTGIRKAVLLTRYAALLKNWMIDEHNHLRAGAAWNPGIGDWTGIAIPSEAGLSQWERQSAPLSVSAGYKQLFARFADYFAGEMRAIGDNDLQQELTILDTLSRYR